ncbi:hypothetical protein SAMN05428967_3399 [Phyllobacterium sp. YR620]|uniref:hypothetical protein n=1 Tax=Phyllobacterium TaxID=28100 RepID=UPI000481508A|nr:MULTISPECIES: hypothetical protein [unclassified Phyllobacterium]MRG56384.1 hypothetical protein [Phyllobacterium sp. SYP-B3895]UGY10695.1 hypothetical protein LLE51_005860 [Phyllobacterium sp. T1018]SDP77691.1 hypothetical protein SAMN05428967_3399 [Phyllobacterium sp. YR620]SFI60700.1 hypothetical protein SAMN04515648_0734 [Phyllobacterium sp. CL33Tsu]
MDGRNRTYEKELSQILRRQISQSSYRSAIRAAGIYKVDETVPESLLDQLRRLDDAERTLRKS